MVGVRLYVVALGDTQSQTGFVFCRTASPDSERHPVSFPEWKESLAAAPLGAAVREQHRMAILTFLRLCKIRHAPATVALVREHLADPKTAPGTREALRWFFREGRKHERQSAGELKSRVEGEAQSRRPDDSTASGREIALSTESGIKSDPQSELSKTAGRMPALLIESRHPARRRSSVPILAASDLGGADWERDLIKATREAGFLWRTEETYRGWAARFARFIAPRSPCAAGAKEVGEFLSALAVEQRAAPSTQKQALNALVFLMQTALHRELGELEFQRPRPKGRVPTVLSPDECRRVFSRMEGMTRSTA